MGSKIAFWSRVGVLVGNGGKDKCIIQLKKMEWILISHYPELIFILFGGLLVPLCYQLTHCT